MARSTFNIPDSVDKEMRHEAVELGLRYPGEFVEFLWKQYKKNKNKEINNMFQKLLESIRKYGYTTAHFNEKGEVLDFRSAPTGFNYNYENSSFALGFNHDPNFTEEDLERYIDQAMINAGLK